MNDKLLLDTNFITKMGLDYIKANHKKFEDILTQTKYSDLSDDIYCRLVQELTSKNPTTEQDFVDIFMLAAAYANVNDVNLNKYVQFSPKSLNL